MNGMNDDRMDEMLIEAVRDYNAPGAVPREEMWAAIRAARGAARAAEPRMRWGLRAGRWGMLAAAGVILAVGIAIGRRVERASPVLVSSPVVAVKPVVVEPKLRDTLINQAREATHQTARRVQELASADVRQRSAPSSQRGDVPQVPAPSSQPSLAYRLVVLQHLAGSEAMITSFRTSARSGQVDAQVASWAKELLSTTRLLEGSDAGKDPVMKRLLDDLDLVISQIVQYTTRGVTDAEELDLIEQSINKRGVITKLRSTIPGRMQSAGT